jgi:predicted acyl esterase
VEISSSNFPRFDRNPNTGEQPGRSTEMVSALQNIFHTGAHASHIVLPVIPAE